MGCSLISRPSPDREGLRAAVDPAEEFSQAVILTPSPRATRPGSSVGGPGGPAAVSPSPRSQEAGGMAGVSERAGGDDRSRRSECRPARLPRAFLPRPRRSQRAGRAEPGLVVRCGGRSSARKPPRAWSCVYSTSPPRPRPGSDPGDRRLPGVIMDTALTFCGPFAAVHPRLSPGLPPLARPPDRRAHACTGARRLA